MASSSEASPIKVNRAPVLTLWAAVVAERLGHPPETALSLAKAVAGTAARAKARRLGLAEEADRAKERGNAAPVKPRDTVHLLGREIRLTHDRDGVVLADDDSGKPLPAQPVETYVIRAFGDRLTEVRTAMEDLAAKFEPDELNRIGFRLYERFRPEVPADVKGWGAKGELRLERVAGAGSE